MTGEESDVSNEKTLEYLITHVFCPLKLPDGDDHSLDNDRALSAEVSSTAYAYSQQPGGSAIAQWQDIVEMLLNLDQALSLEALDEALIESQIELMEVGDVLVYLIRAQNAAVIFRRHAEETLVESFEVSPRAEAVMGAAGKLVCSYPGPAITVPNDVFDDAVFRAELANFLTMMDIDVLAPATTRKARSEVVEERDTAHPCYITELLTGILRAVGQPADINRISKRVGDDVVWKDSRLPWRRSSLWLVIRVAMQTTFDRNGLGRSIYKTFMLFFMNNLARKALEDDMSNDVLHWTSAKLSRRLTKLGAEAPEWLSENVLKTCTDIRTLLDKRWKRVQVDEATSPAWNLSKLDFSADMRLTLLSSSGYIRNALQTDDSASPPSGFKPKSRLRGTLDDFLSVDRTFFELAYEEEPYVTLYDLEREVREGIDDWVTSVSPPTIDDACERLELLLSSYSSAARRSYEGNPEDLSRMLLTVIELWIALDKLVVNQIPILRDYSPEIPDSLLEQLLFRDPLHLQRLTVAVEYIRKRVSHARSGYSVFSDVADGQSFAVRYFEQSSHLRSLRNRILDDARTEKEAKCRELAKENERHARLRQEALHTRHTYTTNRYGREIHDARRWCPSCRLEKEINDMKITVHEWPLPTHPRQVARVVFELDCPVSFNMWRSAIFHLLVDLCSSEVDSIEPYLVLQCYPGLQDYYVEHSRYRITLASDTKPFIQCHYRETRIPSNESRVCVNNGLDFFGFDTGTSTLACKSFKSLEISSFCTYQLPEGPYQYLHQYLEGTTHTSNEVLCNQANCHKDLSIHEFTAFGYLRSGPSLQWLNMLREVRANTLRFRRDEVHLLLAQASCQVGPVTGASKLEWHDELCRHSFRYAFLKELEGLVTSVSGNWLEAMTMATVAFLVARMLATDIEVHDAATDAQALGLLSMIREKTFSWVLELSGKVESTTNEEEKKDIQGRLRDVAAICRSTFEVGSIDAWQVLYSPRSLEILLSCAIVIHDNTPAELHALSATSRLLISRDRRLAWKLERIVYNVIKDGNEGIDLAIKHVWPTYRGDVQWKGAGLENCSWIMSAPRDQQSQEIGLDILDGTLLVNGRSLGRLPLGIQKDPLFTSIFGGQVLEVVPGDMLGMEYATRGFISEHCIYFRMTGGELVIKAKKRECDDVLQLIPPHKLVSDLPRVLIENHVHWLDLSTSSIEIRPLSSMWQSSEDNWCIQFAPGVHSMTKGRSILFDIRSPTWEMLSALLKPLQNSHDIMITWDCRSSTVSVDLPRYGLSFFINSDWELESRHPRGMVYDRDQSIGTLFGLVNKLVLRPKSDLAEELIHRQALIPEGKVGYWSSHHHVEVTVDIKGPAHRSISYHVFKIDTDLGYLAGNSGLASNLYRAYLHALCSNPCSVDPLTGKTGTEEALTILRSAAARSFLKMDCRAAKLLGCIATLTTKRDWYPTHLQCMQTVHWTSLPPASQHHNLYLSCVSIKEIHENLENFHEPPPSSPPSSPAFKEFPERNGHLLRRIGLRAALLDPSEFRDKLAGNQDNIYEGRDMLQVSAGEPRAYSTARFVYLWSPEMPRVMDVRASLESWGQPLERFSEISLRYSKDWLSPELCSIWLSLYDTCRHSQRRRHRFQLLFTLPAMVYASPDLEEVALTLLAFATVPEFIRESPPSDATYHLSDGYMPPSKKLYDCIALNAVQHRDSPEVSYRDYKQRLQRDAETLHSRTVAIWPHWRPPSLYFLKTSLYNLETLTSNLDPVFESCYRNWHLKQHLERVQQILNQAYHSTLRVVSSLYSFVPASGRLPAPNQTIALEHLINRQAPVAPLTLQLVTTSTNSFSAGSEGLRALIEALRRKGSHSFRAKYAGDLDMSKDHLVHDRPSFSLGSPSQCADLFKAHYKHCKSTYLRCPLVLADSFAPRTHSERAVFGSGQWPRVTVTGLLGCLASTSRVEVPPNWRGYLISLAKLALEYQRSRRMLLLATNGQLEDLRKEMENIGCIGWDAESHPDWLLIQLEGNFLIRHIQTNVAFEMISPRSGKNTALQLHMGEGKSSVIVPMAASDLADGAKLVRVVVPKALTAQMFHLLVERVGGLTNRRVYHLPFSRSLNINQERVESLHAILDECRRERGILVLQPDHILSFKLLSVEKQLQGGGDAVGTKLLQIQQWLHLHARDILDESDEILHVRNQLVYTIGLQRPLEGFPYRWTTTQQILGFVRKHAAVLHSSFPLKVEYKSCKSRDHTGAFPHIRLLHPDAAMKLVHLIVQDIMDGQLSDLIFTQADRSVQGSIRNFLTETDVDPYDVQMVQDYGRATSTWTRILHLRGLLACGILAFALTERRWRVGFGLAPSRTMLAVPYRAKDVPAPRAEFGHPDVAVVLTCLSYYYQGLDEKQLRSCFELLLQLDSPDLEYELWVRDWPSAPEYLRQVSGINVKSLEQWNTLLFPIFSCNQATIDFYLSRVVFPKEAKEFPFKLSSSGWDLAEEKTHVTTGFSGTNDGRYLLPTSITQQDPDHQRGTNAKVLAYLLQPENDEYRQISSEDGERRKACEFLKLVVDQQPEIRVILDVGAQVLELKNREFAVAWLKLKPDAKAAIYFDEDDELSVLTQEGTTQLLRESSFERRLDECVVYLDDVHTRGTDIKFPVGFRAAVTLGPKVTKDRLTQGCMRMRKLGHSHSVMFFAPLDVDRAIHAATSVADEATIHTSDILLWAMHETCTEIQNRAPHWAQQGTDHASRYDAWSKFCRDEITSDELATTWCQPDAKSLEQLYPPIRPRERCAISILEIRQRCADLGILSLPNSNMDEEQEREIVHEIERELQVERPPPAVKATHRVSDNVRYFVRTGILITESDAFVPIFNSFHSRNAPPMETSPWTERILATYDFCKVIRGAGDTSEYLRPVNWILSGAGVIPILVILSPYEVNELLSDIRRSKHVRLHIYTPRVQKAMSPCDNLGLYTIPTAANCVIPTLQDQLDLFAGQLYLRDYETYIRLCRFLCIYAKDLEDQGEFRRESDGFIAPANRPPRAGSAGSFSISPLPFLQFLIGLRRKGMPFSLTHMGNILDGRPVREEDFEVSLK
ncbi:hypothetical protein J3A83DRAFT_4087275 [Scleroderma citrinum]